MLRSYLLLLIFFLPTFAYTQQCKLKHQGKKRKYILHLPEGYDSTKQYPLVFNFHGLGGTHRQQRKYSQMNCVADKEGFIVVYPKGIRRFWNTGVTKMPYQYGRDDVGFVKALMEQLMQNYSIDTLRIYSSGMSLGGYFTYRLACEMGNRFAAIASVTGVLSDSTECLCDPSANIPVLHIHGTRDPIVKYNGIRRSNSVEETLDFWLKQNRCVVPADTTVIPDRCPTDKSSVTLIKYASCENNSEVWFYKILNGGHTWPGTRKNYIITGRINYDINGSEVVWDFFKRFSR